MNTFLVTGLAVALVIIIILLMILVNMKSKNKDIKKSTKNTYESKLLVVKNITLPKKISQMDNLSLSKASKQVFESFKSLDYVNKTSGQLDKVEWHSWQVSLLLAMLKANNGFFVPNDDSLFHELILDNNKNTLLISTQKIIDKYNNSVNVNKSRDELSHDIIWSSKEVSILFYYMSKN